MTYDQVEVGMIIIDLNDDETQGEAERDHYSMHDDDDLVLMENSEVLWYINSDTIYEELL